MGDGLDKFKRFYNRTGYVVLSEGKKFYDDFRGLNFRFRFEQTASRHEGIVSQGEVGICGLSFERIKAWSSFCNTDSAVDRDRRVTVYAGYEETGANPIFQLPIAGASPTPPPDMWLNIMAWSGWIGVKQIQSGSITTNSDNGLTPREVCQKVADILGRKLVWLVGSEDEKTLPNIYGFSWAGSVNDTISTLNSLGFLDVQLGVQSGSWEEMWKEKRVMKVYAKSYEHSKAQSQKRQKNAKLISMEEGMVGVPKYEIGKGAMSVKTLLRTDIDVGDSVKVVSELMPSVSDYYMVNKIEYHGELRGSPWETTYHLTRGV